MSIEPDTKDWTWVLERPCPECGLVAGEVAVTDLATAIRENASVWAVLLRGDPDVRVRPAPAVWSPLEYACHVRDVHRLFEERVLLMLDEDEPRFANWDQDETAVASRYDRQDPDVVARELLAAAGSVAETYATVDDDAWVRRGRRSDGSEFTVASLGRYHLHDVVHHLHDVAHAGKRATVAAYDASVEDYRTGTVTMPESVAAVMERFVAALPPGARVLEIGSGPGRDAVALERAGLSVRRTDITPGFVGLLRAEGHAADVVDPLVDDLADPERDAPYDGVWASACLLHVRRDELPVVARRLAEATREGGLLHVSVKEGDGDVWSTHGNVAAPRLFTLWREGPLHALLDDAGWHVLEHGRGVGQRGEYWLDVLAVRR